MDTAWIGDFTTYEINKAKSNILAKIPAGSLITLLSSSTYVEGRQKIEDFFAQGFGKNEVKKARGTLCPV